MFNNKVIYGTIVEGYKYSFIGETTHRRIQWRACGDSFQDIYDKLLDMRVVDYDDDIKYALKKLNKDYTDYLDENEESDYYAILEDANLNDEDFKNIISSNIGNAYYQDFYEWDAQLEDYKKI